MMRALAFLAALFATSTVFAQGNTGPAIQQLQQNPSAGRSALGLGTAATQPATAFDAAGLAAAEAAMARDAANLSGGTIPAGRLVGSNASGANVTATGTTTARSLAERAADEINAGNYGAKCDGSVNDAIGINLATAAIRAGSPGSGTLEWPIGRQARLTLPHGTCQITTTINLTGFYGSGFVPDFTGSKIVCRTNGTPCIDATGLGQTGILGLNLYGASTNSPNIGVSIGRITNNGVGADHLVMDHPTIVGYFTLTPWFNNQSEVTTINGGYFVNQSPNAYGAINDGSNHFNVQSAFTGQTYPPDTPFSFNEFTCIGCFVGVYGSGSIPIWMGGTARHHWTNSYAFASSSTPASPVPGIVLYSATGVTNDFLDLDIHFEDFGGQHNLANIIRFDGAAMPVVHGLRLRDHYPQQSGPLFKRGPGVTSVTIQDADLHLGILAGISPSWWDTPGAFSVGGRIYSQDSSYIAPGTISGMVCLGVDCQTTFLLPSTLIASTLANPGGVNAVSVATGGSYSNGTAPTITVGAPPSGGQQATAAIATWQFLGFGTLVPGTGYAVNDILYASQGTPSGGSPTQATAFGIKVLTVDGSGTILTFTYNGAAGIYTTLPPAGATVLACGTPCSGSGAGFTGTAWRVASTAVTAAGSGYLTPPTATFINGTCGLACAATGGTSLSSTFTATAGNGKLLLDGGGTKLGLAGATGAPVLTLGAMIDNSGVRQTLTSAYAVPANTSLVRFVQTGTLPASTVTLPTAFADGQPIQFVSYTGIITALTFSPSVGGWTNGTSMAANTAIRIRWDSTSAAWFREQ